MTIKQLVTSKHPILNKPIPDVTKYLEDTMYDVEASAICAPQIGVAQKVAMIDMEMDGLLQLINPQIISESDTKVTDLEGSISIPNVYGEVERSKMIVVKSNDKKGNEVEMTAYDDIARMILHMIDHFEGRLFTERVEKFLSESEMEAYFDNE